MKKEFGNRRVLVDMLNLATPQIAGVGVFTKNLFHYWLVNDIQYEIVCYTPLFLDVEKIFGLRTSGRVTVRKIKVRHVLSRLLYQQLVLPFHLRQFSLYFNPTVGIPFFSKLIAPKVKLVVTIHDMTPFVFIKKYSKVRSFLVRFLSKNAARTADKVITVSKNSALDIVTFAGVSASKIQVIYNFVIPPYELDNDHDAKFFLCISTIEPGKNPEKTIEGFARFIRQTGLNYKFYWIGRFGWVLTEDHIRECIKKNNVEDSFVVMGYVPEAEKREFLRNCTGIVYLSFYEGFGLPVLEGMAFNKPSVISNVSSLPEVAGETGVKCDPNDIESIALALQHIVEYRKHLINKIPDQIARFDPKTEASRFMETIDGLIV